MFNNYWQTSINDVICQTLMCFSDFILINREMFIVLHKKWYEYTVTEIINQVIFDWRKQICLNVSCLSCLGLSFLKGNVIWKSRSKRQERDWEMPVKIAFWSPEKLEPRIKMVTIAPNNARSYALTKHLTSTLNREEKISVKALGKTSIIYTYKIYV